MTFEKRAQKFHTDEASLPRSGSASDWLNQISHAAQPIRSTTQVWEVTGHQYGISALISKTPFDRETSGSVAKCRLFSQATGTAVILDSQLARPSICLSFEHNLQCSLLGPHLFPPHHRILQWLWLLPFLNLPFVQESDNPNSLPKSENAHNVCLDYLDLIFVTFKTPTSWSCTYCDCSPNRAFETLNISKEPISKTSRFFFFVYAGKL